MKRERLGEEWEGVYKVGTGMIDRKKRGMRSLEKY